MHSSMAVVAWLQAMRLVSVYSQGDAQSYGSRCMALGHAFGVRGLMHNRMAVDAWL